MEKIVYSIFAFVIIGLLIVTFIYLDKYAKANSELIRVTEFKDQLSRELTTVRENHTAEKTQRQKFEAEIARLNGVLEHERKQHELDIDAVNVALDKSDTALKELKQNSISLGVSNNHVNDLGFAVYSYLRALGMKHSEIIEGQYFSNTYDWEERYNREYEILKASQAGNTPPDSAVTDISNLFEDVDAAYKSMDKAVNGHLDSEPVIAELTNEALGYKPKEMKPLKGKTAIIGAEVTGGVTKKRASRKKEDKTTK